MDKPMTATATATTPTASTTTSPASAAATLAPHQRARIRAITLDLDDTLWPFLPVIRRAEQVLHDWLLAHAPRTAPVLAARPGLLRELREAVQRERPELAHDLSGMRLESIRRLLLQAGEGPALARPAFDAFFAERQRVVLYDDTLPALDWLAARFALVAVSNGNADVARAGLGRYFRAAFSASSYGKAKPHADIFHAAAAAAGVPAAAVLHVGDDPRLDVAGAHAAGMLTAWVARADADGSLPDWRQCGEGPPPHLTVPDLGALCTALQGPSHA
jgi:putative hydrolase of the HAD superfamily